MYADDALTQQLNETWKMAQAINPEILFSRKEPKSQQTSDMASQLKQLLAQVSAIKTSVRGKENELSRMYGGGSGEQKTRRRDEGAANGTSSDDIDAMNSAATRKWQRSTIQNSTLLAGASYLEHVPGSQYCINAGLHHHHHVRRESPPAPAAPALPKWDKTWFVTMEKRLQEIGDIMAGLANRLNGMGTHL